METKFTLFTHPVLKPLKPLTDAEIYAHLERQASANE